MRLFLVVLLLLAGCARSKPQAVNSYFDTTGRADAAWGGVRMIPITTPRTVNVMTNAALRKRSNTACD